MERKKRLVMIKITPFNSAHHSTLQQFSILYAQKYDIEPKFLDYWKRVHLNGIESFRHIEITKNCILCFPVSEAIMLCGGAFVPKDAFGLYKHMVKCFCFHQNMRF